MKVKSQDDHWFCSLNLVASCENRQLNLGSFNVQYETCGLVVKVGHCCDIELPGRTNKVPNWH